MTRQSVTHLPVQALVPHPKNVRTDLGDLTELARSIVANGLLQPIVVTEHPTQPRRFLILAGHRRAAAAVLARLDRVPCIIRHDVGGDEAEHLSLMLVENCQRADIGPLEKADAIGKLMDVHGLTKVEVGRRIGLSTSAVDQYVLLLHVDDETREGIERGEILLGEARTAVKQERAARRAMTGQPVRGRPTVVEPAHLTEKHPLGARVADICTHTRRPLVGKAGCGQCWEQAIREDAAR